MGLREKKKWETRDAISNAGLRLAMERGSAAVSVDDIAEAANVAPRTLFNYFSSKEDAILGYDKGWPEALAERLRQRPADEPPLRALFNATLDDRESPRLWHQRGVLARLDPPLSYAYLATLGALGETVAPVMASRMGSDAGDIVPRLVVKLGWTAIRVAATATIDLVGVTDDELREKFISTAVEAIRYLANDADLLAAPSESA